MLLGKLAQKATFVQQQGPFQSTSVDAHYFTAIARPYRLGADQTTFEVLFGNYVPAISGVEASEGVEAVHAQEAKFDQVYGAHVELTSEDLSSWGTDDKVVLEKIASKYGTSCLEFVTL